MRAKSLIAREWYGPGPGQIVAPGRLCAVILAVGVLAGCTDVTTVHVPLDPKPNHIQVSEVRPTWFSTHTVGVVYDKDSKIVGVTGSGGQAAIQVPLVLIKAAGTVAGSYLVGQGLEALSHIDGSLDIGADPSVLNDPAVAPHLPPLP